jgi:hypothetical protein
MGMLRFSEDPEKNLRIANAQVANALKQVADANAGYVEALHRASEARVELARIKGHPWLGLQVYRIMGAEGLRGRIEHGTVCFKEYGDDDFGNPHLSAGSYYVLVKGKTAHALDNSWELDLL